MVTLLTKMQCHFEKDRTDQSRPHDPATCHIFTKRLSCSFKGFRVRAGVIQAQAEGATAAAMMFTNVFRIGGLQTVSWFELLPAEDASNICRKPLESEDAVTRQLLTAHIHLQNEGHLSSWTLCSVTQEKGRKVKLWLFLPGRHDVVRPALDSGLKVVKHGVWNCPGNPTEVTAALCQALRNRFERALSAFSYVRFGGMFVKCKRYVANDSDFRKTLPSCEIMFTSSEEAIFVCLRVRRRRMRPLAASDIRAVLTQHMNSTSVEKPAVVVAPYGLTGWLTGCCPGDLVRQLTHSKLEMYKEYSIRNSFPQSTVRNAGFWSRSWYVEVRMKFLLARGTPSQNSGGWKSQLKNEQIPEGSQWIEKVFIFPSEAVLVPTVPPVSARTYLKRCWLRKLAGTDWLEDALSLRGFSPLTSLHGHRLQAMGKSNTIWKLNSKSSMSSTSSGSGGSSIKSSDSRGSSGSESDVNDDGEYREDADSAATKAEKQGTMLSSTAQASDVQSKRVPGLSSLKRGREHGMDVQNNASYKTARRSSPDRVSSAANNATFESNSGPGSKGAGSQAGTPWDWNEEVTMQNDADFFAEFGDFGDFFEGDALGFGEPPGTAESQMGMFSFDGEGSSTPGTQYMDTSDPMLLPILDFPMLEGFGQPEVLEKEQDPGVVEDVKYDGDSPSAAVPATVSLVAKYEAALLFDPDYAPVEIPTNQESIGTGESAYRPETRTLMPTSSAKYVYSAAPPPTPKMESYDRKQTEPRWHADVEEGRKRKELNDSSSSKYYDVSSTDAAARGKGRATDFGQYQHSSLQTTLTENWQRFKSPIGMLATDLECAMFQVQLHNVKGVAYCAHPSEPTKPPDSSYKDCVSDITDVSDACDNLLKKQPDRRKKVPERIAGDADEVIHDGPRTVEIGVWRPVGIPKPQKTSDSFRNDVQSLGPSMASAEAVAASENGDTSMHEVVDIIPLLVQQASSLNDISLNGEHGDGALAWLTLHQTLSQESPSLDLESTMSDMCDPSVAEVSPATVASILQSDMRQAMGVAFGEVNVAGPLSLADWCRGKSKVDSSQSDIYSGGSVLGDSKEIVSSITGEPITPPQSTGGGLKAISLQDLDNHSSEYRRSSREAEDSTQRRMSLDAGNTDLEVSSPSYAMFPVPTLLVGYQDDWLKTSPSSLRYWEKAPFEPYGYPKPVTYYVLCIGLDPLLSSAFDFFQQLSTVYEACKLGTHTPANATAQTSTKRMMPGFVTVGFACKLKPTSSSPLNMATNYVTAMESGWDISEFRKSLRKACKSLPISGSTALEADHEHSPSTVVYVVSPTSEPSVVLQTMLESCQGLAPTLSRTRKTSGRSGLEEGKQQIHPVAGFQIGRFALQVVTPETIIRLSSSPASGLDVLKELSFGVYNKLRRIPYRSRAEDVQSGASSKVRIGVQAPQSNTSMPGLWSSNRNSGVGVSVIDAGQLRWEQPWHAPRLLEDATAGHSSAFAQSPRLLYEPLFILADSCLLEHSMGQLVHLSKAKAAFGEETTVQQTSGRSLGLAETVSSAVEGDSRACSQRSTFHCCYAWSTNWQWLISVWTDARGELLDVNVFPVRSISEKDASSKELSQLFAQVIQQGLQLLSLAVQAGGSKVHNIVVVKIGEFYDTEYQEWQRVCMAMGADEARTWSVQIRPENVDYQLSQQRNVHGLTNFSSPGTSSSFTSRGMLSGLSKADHIGKSNQALQIDNSNHAFQWVHSVTLATISSDSSLQVLSMADSSAGGPSAATWSTNSVGGLATGFGMAKTISSLNGAYLFVPAHGLRYIDSTGFIPWKGDIPALAQIVQSRGPVSPVASGYVISGSTAASRTELAHMSTEEEWPSTLHVGLVAHFSSSTKPSGRHEPGMRLGGNGLCDTAVKLSVGSKEYMLEARCILEQLGAEMYGLSWLTVSPMYLHRRLALPFHCDVAQRLDKLLCYMNAETTH